VSVPSLKAAEPLAHVLVDRCIKSERRYLQAGLPPCDARQEAERDWLMLEPEDDNGALSGRIC